MILRERMMPSTPEHKQGHGFGPELSTLHSLLSQTITFNRTWVLSKIPKTIQKTTDLLALMYVYNTQIRYESANPLDEKARVSKFACVHTRRRAGRR
jgi:hypothetical protein